MSMTPEQTNELIRTRRSVFPKMYTPQPISQSIIETMLENANHAPTHRLTEPWRFKVLTGAALTRLGEYMADFYKNNTPAERFSEEVWQKNRENPTRAGAIIAICMQRDPETRIPEWEEIAAVACAVQNMWLTCTAHGIGSYWSTPTAALQGDAFFGLQAGERCLGLFYMGYHNMPELPAKRRPIAEKVTWLTE